jgi:F0F1-type ATP synthase membrane subunit b/b'
MAMQLEIERLKGKVEALQDELMATRAEMRQQAQEIHRSYRNEIVLRSEMLPDVRRNRRVERD